MGERPMAALFCGVGLGTTALFAAFTVAPLIAVELTGSAAWSGVPGAVAVLGTALGAALVTRWSRAGGRRRGLTAGFWLGALGGAIAVAAAAQGSFLLLLAGMAVLGAGHSSNQLARYAAGDLVPSERRASAIGWIIWAGTVGALVGPNLAAPAGRLATRLGLPATGGGFVAVAAFFAAAAVLYALGLRNSPVDGRGPSLLAGDPVPPGGFARQLRHPRIGSAVIAMVVGQAVMILVMTVTPVHLSHHGQGLSGVGLVMSGHLVGMYVLAPVAGRVADRIGSIPVILAGQALLGSSALLAAVARPAAGGLFLVALVMLGVGWSCGLVGASALLTRGMGLAEALRLQGAAETLIWAAAAVASLGSGLLLSARGYTVLCVVAALCAIVPIAMIVSRRRALGAARHVVQH